MRTVPTMRREFCPDFRGFRWTPADLLDGELGADLLRWSRHRDREDAGFAARVLAAVRRGVGVDDGYVDTVGGFAWKSGKSRPEIRRLLRLAELAELLPETGQAWRRDDHDERGGDDRGCQGREL